MNKPSKRYFRFDWVLVNEIAIGPAPKKERHLALLNKEGIVSILSLCREEESQSPGFISNEFEFTYQRVSLPDHKTGKMPTINELEKALESLAMIKALGPVFVHCVASMERSPLVCLAWLVREKKLSIQQSLDYLMQVHPGTNPLPKQLELLKQLV